MRPGPGEALTAPEELRHLPPPQPSPSYCDPPSSCTHWQTSQDFEANIVVVLIVLLCALICIFALNGAIRCFFTREHTPGLNGETSHNTGKWSLRRVFLKASRFKHILSNIRIGNNTDHLTIFLSYILLNWSCRRSPEAVKYLTELGATDFVLSVGRA